MNARPCLFFDRDGIVNISPGAGYVTTRSAFHIRPEFIACARVAERKKWPLIIVSNQRGVSTGQTPQTELAAMDEALRARLAAEGCPLLDSFYCTAAEDAHPHRKPNPGMLLAAAAKHHLDLSRSWMIGDRERDVLTGENAGVAVTVRVDDDGTAAPPAAGTPTRATHRLDRLAELPALLDSALQPLSP